MVSTPQLPRLIALDMDGTLLDGAGNLPADYPELAARARGLGIVLIPASGRQLATLRAMFPGGESFIAENGAVVMHGGDIIDTSPLPKPAVARVVDALAGVRTEHVAVLSTPTVAYVQRGMDPRDLAEVEKYYHAMSWVDALGDAAGEDIIKIALYCRSGSEATLLGPVSAAVPEHAVAVSGQTWLDVTASGVNKGRALARFAHLTGVPLERTAAFGDYLNDYDMLRTAGLAVAMGNAHPRLKEIADVIAPPNTQGGVSTVLRQIFSAEALTSFSA